VFLVRDRRFGFAVLSLAFASAVLGVTASVSAQEKEKKPSPGAPAPSEADKQKAIALYEEGKKAQEARDYVGALAKFEEAYKVFPDPNLLLAIGEVYRLRGGEQTDSTAFKTDLNQAIIYYERYLNDVPAGKSPELDKQRAAAQQRIEALRQGVKEAEARQREQEQSAKAEREEEERRRRAEEERRLREEESKQGLQLALDALVMTGVATDLTGIGRIIAGGMGGWGRYGLDAHLAFQGFLRTDNSQGVSGRSITVLDLGPRVTIRNNSRSIGPFVTAGAGFGFFSGSPHQRRFKAGNPSCAILASGGAEPPPCAFDIDKHFDVRVGFGWGFEAASHTTVAVRVDLVEWFYSVDETQDLGSPPAGAVEKPQTALSFFFGLEFLRWR
jgi:hypothetical protein